MKDRILANSKVNPATPLVEECHCRDWTGSIFKRADWPEAPREQCYGRIGKRFKAGPRKGKTKAEGAHRESVRAFKPYLRVGSKNTVRHMCHRPICVEPRHLLGGKQKQNVRDCVRAGHHRTPFRGKRAKGKNTCHTAN